MQASLYKPITRLYCMIRISFWTISFSPLANFKFLYTICSVLQEPTWEIKSRKCSHLLKFNQFVVKVSFWTLSRPAFCCFHFLARSTLYFEHPNKLIIFCLRYFSWLIKDNINIWEMESLFWCTDTISKTSSPTSSTSSDSDDDPSICNKKSFSCPDAAASANFSFNCYLALLNFLW